MLIASIVADGLAAFGCFSLTVLLIVLAGVLAAARLGYAPGVAWVLERLATKPGGGPSRD